MKQTISIGFRSEVRVATEKGYTGNYPLLEPREGEIDVDKGGPLPEQALRDCEMDDTNWRVPSNSG